MKSDTTMEQVGDVMSERQAEAAAGLQREITRRRRLGRIWIVLSLAWWLATIPPIVYVTAMETPCATRFLPNWLIGGCP
jgi:hypothetical protein